MLDLAGRGRFGPDVDWISQIDYRVDPKELGSLMRPFEDIGRNCLKAVSFQITWRQTTNCAAVIAKQEFVISGPVPTVFRVS